MIKLHRRKLIRCNLVARLAQVLHSNTRNCQCDYWYIACALDAESAMEFDTDLISQTLEHRGCGILAASYEIQPRSWLPEACVWLQTEAGHRKIWVHSFAHCFAAEELTFPNRLDADSWALVAAKSIIDRALEGPLGRQTKAGNRARHLSGIFGFARHAVFNLRRFHHHRSRQ